MTSGQMEFKAYIERDPQIVHFTRKMGAVRLAYTPIQLRIMAAAAHFCTFVPALPELSTNGGVPTLENTCFTIYWRTWHTVLIFDYRDLQAMPGWRNGNLPTYGRQRSFWPSRWRKILSKFSGSRCWTNRYLCGSYGGIYYPDGFIYNSWVFKNLCSSSICDWFGALTIMLYCQYSSTLPKMILFLPLNRTFDLFLLKDWREIFWWHMAWWMSSSIFRM